MAKFKKILVANRGEIACRIMRTAKAMGIRTVAVYSEADKRSLHVEMADEAVALGGSTPSESYLDIEAVVAAAKKTKAQAVHPGFGFLSENTRFAKALDKAGIIFIGPNAKAIEAMGDKITSKKIAEKAGVNIIPGFPDAVADAVKAEKIAKDVGFPVMLKASAGGGGKGMRIARSQKDVKSNFEAAVREAEGAFGDGRIFVEKFIEQPRHIEIQVLADQHGNVVYLGERECSIQRRHQKIIEEAPSPFLDEETRRAMGEQAVKLAKAVDYISAGTVEFIVDKDKNFYFLEMNTRLQVEHPVTEFITGLDLVAEMIRVAQGEKLRIGQNDVKLDGWAIEARIYAEDPFRGFLPSVGRLVGYQPPQEGSRVRLDTGVREGDEVSPYYDPMLAKLVTYGEDRAHALETMRDALDAFHIRGISHNIAFLAAVMRHKRFVAGDISTHFIEEEYPDGFHPSDLPHDDPEWLAAVAGALHYRHTYRDEADQPEVHWSALTDHQTHPLRIRNAQAGILVEVGERDFEIATRWRPGQRVFVGAINGDHVCLQVEFTGIAYKLTHGGSEAMFTVVPPRAAELIAQMPVKEPPDLSGFVLSPMPGLLISLLVKEGQEVKTGEELCVVEAMKMENVIRAERDGVIKSIEAAEGDNLSVDQVIMSFE